MARVELRIAAAVAAVGIGGPVVAQDDPLAQVKALRAVADQKAEAHVRETLAQADTLAKTSPPAAAKALQETLLGLGLSAELSAEKRAELVALVHAKLDAVRRPVATPTPPPAPTAAQKEATRKAFDAHAAEAKAVREGLAEVAKLDAEHKTTQAHAKAAELAARYPNNPSVLALVGQGTFGQRVAAARDLARQQDDRVLWVFNDVSRTALPPKGDIEYPANWKELTAARLKGARLDPQTEAILKALDRPVPKTVSEVPFEEGVQTLSNLIDQPLYLDKRALEDAGLDVKRPVSIPGGVNARTALRAVLQSLGLTFIIKDGVIQVVTLEQAKSTLVTRSYYLGDVLSNGPLNNALRFGPEADYQQTLRNAQDIVDSVTKSIDPFVWSGGQGRGPATIFFHPPSLSLIVRAPTEVHAAITGKMAR